MIPQHTLLAAARVTAFAAARRIAVIVPAPGAERELPADAEPLDAHRHAPARPR